MGQVNSYPDITSLENSDLLLAWENSPPRVANIALSVLRDFLNSGAISTVDDVDLTASRALVSNSSGKIAVSTLTSAQLASLSTLLTAVKARNFILNGDFRVAQSGTSFASVADGTYLLDGWRYSKSGAAVHDVSQSSDVPTFVQSNFKSSFSLLADCTTVDAAIAAGDFVTLRTFIEGYDLANLQDKEVTLSFWVKATKTGTYCVSFQNSAANRSYVAEYTVNVTDTWEQKTITLTLDSTGSWDYTNDTGLRINFALAAGSTYQASVGWGAGNYLATSNQVNGCDNTANNFRLAQVRLTPGSTAAEFEEEPYGRLLRRCQRQYWRAGNSAVSGYPPLISAYASANGDNLQYFVPFPVEMRAVPTGTVNGTWVTTNCTGPTAPAITKQGFAFAAVAAAAGMCFCATNSVDDYIAFDARLS